jgi:sirohydrochlorin cobaltochelatase
MTQEPVIELPHGPEEFPGALRDVALVLFAIGSSRTSGPAQSLDRHAHVLDQLGSFRCVRSALLIGGPSPSSTIAGLRTPVFIVPMMMCTGWIWSTQIPSALGLACGSVANGAPSVHLCDPVGQRVELAGLLGARGCAAARRHGLNPADTTLLLVAHGTDRDQGSQHATDLHAARLRSMGLFGAVRTAYLDQAPTIPETVARLGCPTIVAGLFATPGPHAETDVPRLIAEGNSSYVLDYLGPIGADAAIPEIILNLAVDELQKRQAPVQRPVVGMTTEKHCDVVDKA